MQEMAGVCCSSIRAFPLPIHLSRRVIKHFNSQFLILLPPFHSIILFHHPSFCRDSTGPDAPRPHRITKTKPRRFWNSQSLESLSFWDSSPPTKPGGMFPTHLLHFLFVSRETQNLVTLILCSYTFNCVNFDIFADWKERVIKREKRLQFQALMMLSWSSNLIMRMPTL